MPTFFKSVAFLRLPFFLFTRHHQPFNCNGFGLLLAAFLVSTASFAQDHSKHSNTEHHGHTAKTVSDISSQPLLAQALRLKEALSYLGSSLSPNDEKALEALQHQPPTSAISEKIQQILDPYCLSFIDINPESRVKVDRGPAKAQLIQGGWTSFLVKVKNDAGSTAVLQVESINALSPVHMSSTTHTVNKEDIITRGQAANRFLDAQMYNGRPLQPNLTGFKLEYAVVQLYSSEAGQREVEIGFNVGQGSQDIGFRNTVAVLFNIQPSVKVKLHVKDHDGRPVMASFTITDSIHRMPGRLSGVYPLPSRRVAAYDEYPDFFFQQQVYRKDGEHVLLPSGKYHVTYTRGPEYIPQTKEIVIPENTDSFDVSFQLQRWIDLSKSGWYSGDHHVHAAGCKHYDSPEEGVPPYAMWRQVQGEALNIAALLTWGPSWYHQKNNFTGKDNSFSTQKNIMRYDVEVSGFPSSHAGHLVLLNLKEDDYPGTTKVEEWPSWTLPVLKWARSQGGLTGYAHSGFGLEPITPTNYVPNYVLPKMDGIGANEYVVTVTHDAVDFYSLGNTPSIWELNMLYHSLNSGFRTRISGETDFPCITDQRVGKTRSYFKPEKQVSYETYVDALKKGRSYVSDGKSHIMNYAVNKQEVGTKNSEIQLKSPQPVQITADIAAYLKNFKEDASEEEFNTRLDGASYWSIEWARIGKTRNIRAELLINGKPVDTAVIVADGKINQVKFTYTPERSCWAAIRIWGSSHSNPIFITVDQQPIQEKLSVEWCLNSLEQCWKMKEPNIRPEEKADAKTAYDFAREVYRKILAGMQ